MTSRKFLSDLNIQILLILRELLGIESNIMTELAGSFRPAGELG